MRVSVNGLPGLKIMNYRSDTFPLFITGVQTSGEGNVYFEPGNPVEVNGITFSACIPSACSSGSGLVPTVSEWGLVVMTLLLLTSGTLVLRHRRSVAA